LPIGIILKGIGGFYYVKTQNTVYECKAKGIFRREDQIPLPGDEVNISIIDEVRAKGNIDKILPRRSHLIRPHVANINQIFIVISAKSPVPDLMLLDKLLITAEIKNIDVVICINKIDLDENQEYKSIESTYSKAGYKILKISSKLEYGFDHLKDLLKNKITVFSGQSGVGKSTILNRIMKSMVMKTGDVSQKIERGKHTTRHAELIELEEGGFVLDTPGFSSFELSDIPFGQLEIYYPEFENLLNKCKFTGCGHVSEPDCVIKEALKSGVVDDGRYNRFITIYNFLKLQKSYDKKK
jgi:ribosome biogenesis GTPase / thiamine phosphate phosphatase